MISIQIKQVALEKGITTGYQFQKISGFNTSMANRIFKGEWTRIDISTLNTICNVLSCTPNDILKFTPDEIDQL